MARRPGSVARLALRFLSLLVPRGLRRRWAREWMGELARCLRKAPWFSLATVLTLALGIKGASA